MSTADRFARLSSEFCPNPSAKKSRKGEPARIKPLPKIGQRLWVKTYDSAIKRKKSKGSAAAIAWATVKKQCAKDYDGVWNCEKLRVKLDLAKRVKKLKAEAKAEEKAQREVAVDPSEVKEGVRAVTKARKMTDAEAHKAVRRLRM